MDYSGKAAWSYDEARILVMQKGSAELVHDLLFDRHIIRIARGNMFNFTCLAISLLMHLGSGDNELIIVCSVISIVIALISVPQWRTRYKFHYRRISEMANLLQ